MYKIGLRLLLMVLVSLIGVAWLGFEPARSESKSHTGKDHINITKITPRTSADIPVPCTIPFTFELSYNLVTANTGKLRVGVFLWRPGTKSGKSQGGALKGLEPLTKPIEKKITKGNGIVTLSTPPVKLPKVNGNNYQVVIVANIQDMTQKELCWSTSYNFLRGSLRTKVSEDRGTRDYVQVLQTSPRLDALATGREHSFEITIRYNLKSKPWGYIGIEVGEQGRKGDVGPWYSMCVPIRRGVGTLQVRTRKFFLPVVLAGRYLELDLPFRVNPLGGTVSVGKVGPWPLQRPSMLRK